MKQMYQAVALISLLFSYSVASARLLPLIQGNELVEAIKTTPADSSMHKQENDTFNLTGLEEVECDAKDEDCIKRRIIAEAHLDYIYTQRNKPKKLSP